MKQALSGTPAHDHLLKLAGITLTEDEKMVSSVTIHDAIYWKGVAVFIIGMFMLPGFTTTLGLFLIFVAMVMIGLAYLTQHYLVLAATNKRVFVRSGIFYADMIEMRYAQVESIELGISPIGQIFGYGSVIVTGTGQRRVIIPYVKRAIEFRVAVNDILVNK